MSDSLQEEDRLFGRVLVELGWVKPEPLADALARQAGALAAGERIRLGAILVQQGVLEPEQLLRAAEVGRRAPLFVCGTCGHLSSPGTGCPRCGGTLCEPPLAAIVDANLAAVAPPIGPPAGERTAVAGKATEFVRSGDAETGAPDADAAGSHFCRYRLLAVLGEGAVGTVWKAWDPQLRRTVALKRIKPDLVPGKDLGDRFEREARLAAGLRHPNIVAVHELGQADGCLYLTMEYVEGTTFKAWLDQTRTAKRDGRVQGTERLRHEVAILADVSGAVAFAHERGVIHRDLKPANVLLDREGRAFVADFGMAKDVGAGETGALTATGQLLGTPLYMSPEQAEADAQRIGPCSDVWSLGAILYEVIAGASPFEGAGKVWDILAAVKTEDPVPPRVRNPHVPIGLEAVALKSLEKDPARRYATARQFEAELRRWLRGEAVEARRPGPIPRVWRQAARHRWAVIGCAVVVAALCVAGASAYWVQRTREQVLESLAQTAGRVLEQAPRRGRTLPRGDRGLLGGPRARPGKRARMDGARPRPLSPGSLPGRSR